MTVLPKWLAEIDRRIVERLQSQDAKLSREGLQRLKEYSMVGGAGRSMVSGFVVGTVLFSLRANNWLARGQLSKKFKENWKHYFLRCPAFLACFTILWKVLRILGRALVGSSGLSAQGKRAGWRRFWVAVAGFISGFVAQTMFPVWTWELSLYAFLRAGTGMMRWTIPKNLQPSGRICFGFLNIFLPFFITYNTDCVPKGYRKFYEDVVDADCDCYPYYYKDTSRVTLPPCWPRQHKHPSCLIAFIRDLPKRMILSMKFYLKFYCLFMLFRIGAVIKNPLAASYNLIKRSFLSTLFCIGIFHFGERFHCFWRQVLRFWYRTILRSDEPIPSNGIVSRTIFLLNSGLQGYIWVGYEAEPKHADIALFTLWKDIEMALRYYFGIHYEKPETLEQCCLSKNLLPTTLFSFAIGMWIWVYYLSPKSLKSSDVAIIEQFLV